MWHFNEIQTNVFNLCASFLFFFLSPQLHLQVLVDLRADNQRLKDENGALIRVISKLSK